MFLLIQNRNKSYKKYISCYLEQKKKKKIHLLNIGAYQLHLNIKMKGNINFKLQNCKPNKFFLIVLLVYNALLEKNRKRS